MSLWHVSTYLPLASAIPWGPRSPEIQFLWSYYIRPLGTLGDKDSPEEMPDTRMVCCPHRKMVNSLPCFTGNLQTVLSIIRKSQNQYGLIIKGDRKRRFGKIRISGRNVLILLSSDANGATEKCYKLYPHGLDGGLWGFLAESAKVVKASGPQETSSCSITHCRKVWQIHLENAKAFSKKKFHSASHSLLFIEDSTYIWSWYGISLSQC